MLSEREKKFLNAVNRKNGCGIDKPQIFRLIREHQKARANGNEDRMAGIEYRLNDINFYTEAGMMAEGKYDELKKHIKEVWRTAPVDKTHVWIGGARVSV